MLRAGPPEIVFCLAVTGGETSGEPQHLLQAGESEAGAETGLRHLAVDVGEHFTSLTEKHFGKRSRREEV